MANPQLFVPAPIDLKRLELVFKPEVSESCSLLEPKDQVFWVIVVACEWDGSRWAKVIMRVHTLCSQSYSSNLQALPASGNFR